MTRVALAFCYKYAWSDAERPVGVYTKLSVPGKVKIRADESSAHP